jgi:integrase
MLGIIRAWLTFARDRNYRPDNPLLRIRKLKGGRYRAWTDQELTQFEECWPLGTRERTAYALALYWGQRKMDVKMLRWPMIQGDEIHLSDGQSKTGTPMVIAMHSELRKALDAIRPEGTPMGPVLTTIKGSHGKKAGSQISAGHFGGLMADAIETAGLPKECVLHRLRVTHSRIVAETGGRVSATTGHMSANMERRYARDADQRKMARDNVLKWERRTKQESVKL